MYIVSFRRYCSISDGPNCFDLIGIDPLDPKFLSPDGRWRLLGVFLIMSVLVNTAILFIFPLKVFGFSMWQSPIFFLFWGNALYSIGLIQSALENFKLSRSLMPRSMSPEMAPSSLVSPLLGPDLCFGYRLYWFLATTVIVFGLGYGVELILNDNPNDLSGVGFGWFLFLLPLGIGALFAIAYLGAKWLRIKEPRTKYF